jgi:hypothetical protein
MRAHIVLPEELVAEIDRLAGPRGRSRFIEEAVRAKVQHEKQRLALDMVLSMPPSDAKKYPYWRTPEDVSRWVHKMREEGDRLRDPWSDRDRQ